MSSDEEDSGEEEEALVSAFGATAVQDSEWDQAPSYLPLYLSTISEYVPTRSKSNALPQEDGLDGDKSEIKPWAAEGYENSLEIDSAFDKFSARVSHQSDQCLRYDYQKTLDVTYAEPDSFSDTSLEVYLFPTQRTLFSIRYSLPLPQHLRAWWR